MRNGLLVSFAIVACLGLSWLPAESQQPARPGRPPTLAERAAPKPVDIADLPEGFSEKIVVTGITGATAMAIAPDGRIFACEQTGALRVIKNDELLPEPFVTVKVDSSWERGLIGVSLDPEFPQKPHVYLCYVAAEPYPHHRVSRFTARGDAAVPDSEVVLLEGDDQTKLGGKIPAGHQGGAVHFGKDGKLYVAIGDQTAGAPAQRLDTFQGKLLRINPDGSIPEDNPFAKQAQGKYRAVWALGLRNPFAFAVQPGTGRIFINDVGEARWEEINEGAAGANYGWPHAEGPGTSPKNRGPVHAYDRSLGKSITGGTFYNPPVKQFPAPYVGKYFFAEYIDNWIRVLDPDNPKAKQVFATGLAGPVDVQVGPDGSLYYLNRNAWVKDGKFKPGTGSLHRVSYTAQSGRPAPILTAPPDEQTAAVGHSATFTVAAKGEAPLRYQWQRNGVPIEGADSPSYLLRTVTAADDGAQFRCVVTNKHGSIRVRPARLWVAPLRSPTGPACWVQGLGYSYFEGQWTALPDFGSLKPVKTGAATQVDLAARGRDEDIGFTFQGLIEVARDGAYTFSLHSSGAGKLFVSGAEVAGTGLASGRRKVSGTIGLKAGKHSFLLLFAHGAGRPQLEVRCTGPELPDQMLPASAFFRTDPSAPVAPAVKPIPVTGKTPYGLSHRELVTTLHVPPHPAELPPLLSQTGVFRSLADLTPNPGVIPYEVNSPLWSDGALKRRWIALPGGAQIRFAAVGEWQFPAGTVFIKHFEMPADEARPAERRRLETRLLVVDRTGFGYGVTYKWKPDQSDAELLADGLTEEVPVQTAVGAPKRTWSYPSRNDCLVCHTANAGFVLGVKTRQLNGDMKFPGIGVTDNQLRAWNHLGLFEPALREADLPRYERLVPVTDAAASLEHRVRSYLDVNCAQCHRPGGTRGEFDARFDVPLSRQNFLNGPLVSSDLGVRSAKLVSPRDPSRSMLHLRMIRRQDVFNMPPLATNVVDEEAVSVLAEWIRSLPAGDPEPKPK